MKSLKLQDIPKEDRPQEKLYKYGPEKLTDEELLALILRNGTPEENVLFLSKRILANFKTIGGILNASSDELMKIKGVKEAKAAQILSLCELCRRINCFNRSEVKISSPKDCADIVMDEMKNLKQEQLKVIMLNKKNIVIGERVAFVGSLDTSIVHPREIFKPAISNSASSIIICHNHPSGIPEPSKEDINVTLRLKECGRIIGIELLDHLIIGYNKYISLKEKGII